MKLHSSSPVQPEHGVLPCQWIRQALQEEWLQAKDEVTSRQIQPNSLDLRIHNRGYRIQCSFLPGSQGMQAKLEQLAWYEFPLTQDGIVLERNQVYLFPLCEQLRLPSHIFGRANPKSSTGRLDVFCRLVVEEGVAFDEVPAGYQGPLYLEVVPRSFPILVRPGDSLAQMRFHQGHPQLNDEETRQLIDEQAILLHPDATPLQADDLHVHSGVYLTAQIQGEPGQIIGYRAQKNTPPLDLRGRYPIHRFWEPIQARKHAPVILEPDEFYIFASRELFCLPPHICAEMIPFDASRGEIRTHYAGFFDSGFGFVEGVPPEKSAAAAVLEIRSRDVPFLLEDNHPLFRMVFLRNQDVPDQLYGREVKSHYQTQRLSLAKQFHHAE